MPKIVNVEERKKLIAEATWRVILSKGMEGATVRNIAKEAGLSLGALRHYFTNQEELLHYAMNLAVETATARIVEITKMDLPPKEMLLKILLQIVPVDEQTLAEMDVWFAYIASQKHKHDVSNVPFNTMMAGMNQIITNLYAHGFLKNDLDLELEIERLYALVDGLAIHALFERDRLNKDLVVRTLTYHLDTIFV